MIRVPVVDPKREKELERLRHMLAALERIPLHRRFDECADVREATIKSLIAELELHRV